MSNIINLEDYQKSTAGTPLDLAEQLALENSWSYQRRADIGAIGMLISGQWRSYDVTIYWHEDESYLEVLVDLDLKAEARELADAYQLLGMLNNELSLGAIECTAQKHDFCYRYVAVLNGTLGIAEGFVEELLSIAIYSSDRILPALLLLLQSGASPREALEAARLDPQGEA